MPPQQYHPRPQNWVLGCRLRSAKKTCSDLPSTVSHDVEEEDLEELFDEYDYSEIRMPPGKGFAFVSFETNEAAAKAQTECNGKELKGKAIRVALAKPKAPRDDGPELEDTEPLSTFLNEDNVD